MSQCDFKKNKKKQSGVSRAVSKPNKGGIEMPETVPFDTEKHVQVLLFKQVDLCCVSSITVTDKGKRKLFFFFFFAIAPVCLFAPLIVL